MKALEEDKLVEELKALRRPWYKRPEQWAAYIAVICTLAGVGFQYSLHDQNLLIAKNEKSLAEQEKIKAENEKFLVIRERINLGKNLEELKIQLKDLIDAHNKELLSVSPVSPEAKAIITANLQFLDQIEKKVAIVTAAATPTLGETRYFSWVDSLLSAVFNLVVFIVGFIFLYSFLSKKQPELFPALIAAIKSVDNNLPSNETQPIVAPAPPGVAGQAGELKEPLHNSISSVIVLERV